MKKIVTIALFVSIVVSFLLVDTVFAQPRFRRSGFHAGIHSGSWTLKREQILEEESKDPHRSCRAPYCSRCSKHLADYGHEYQFVDGPCQRQLWYRGTAGSIAPVTQRCYDEHGIPYCHRGRPGIVMSWEYRCYLNHAIREQINARNAVAAEEAAEDRIPLLQELYDIAMIRAHESEIVWKHRQETGFCIATAKVALAGNQRGSVMTPCMKAMGATKEGDGLAFKNASSLFSTCEYCLAKATYLKDQAYLVEVEKELAAATQDWQWKTAVADEKVRIALLSKEDADKATRFKRIQHKPPKYKEVLAAQEAAEAAEAARQETEEQAHGPAPQEAPALEEKE